MKLKTIKLILFVILVAVCGTSVATACENTQKYSIFYIVDNTINTQKVSEDTSLNEFYVPQKAGYTFEGWYTSPDLASETEARTPYKVEKDTYLYAKLTPNIYSLTLKYENGAVDEIRNVTFDTTFNLPQPQKAHMNFAGWYTGPAGSGVQISGGRWKNTGNLTLYAHYTDITYSVYFNANSFDSSIENMPQTISLTYGEVLPAPQTQPSRTGYAFGGWFYEPACLYPAVFGAPWEYGQNRTFYAKWTPKEYTLAYSANVPQGETVTNMPEEQAFVFDNAFALSTRIPVRTGYNFSGWYYEKEGIIPVTFGIWKFDTDITVFALWSPKSYVLSYNANAPLNETVLNIPPAENILFASEYDTSDKQPSRIGYDFIGWYREAQGLTPFTSGVWSFAEDITAYASWQALGFTVTYDPNVPLGETVSDIPEPLSVVYSEAFSVSETIPQRAGYTFEGWYYESQAETPFESGIFEIADDITVYAAWSPKSYSVEFDTQGGEPSQIEGTEVDFDSQVTLPEPQKTGYEFGGWYTEPFGNGQKAQTGPWKIAKDTTLYANWLPAARTIILAPNGADAQEFEQISAFTGQPAVLPDTTNYSKEGYTFAGWASFEEASDKNQALSTFLVPVSDTPQFTVYAVWQPAEYVVNFDSRGGSICHPVRILYGQPYTLQTPTKNGYTFQGWYDEAGNRYEQRGIWNEPKGTTLHADWAPVTVTITFNSNGGKSVEPSSMRITTDEDIVLPIPQRLGYLFSGWNTSASGGGIWLAYSDGQLVRGALASSDALAVAIWQSDKSELTFALKGDYYEVSAGSFTSGIVEIPAEYNSIPVRAIADSGFEGLTGLSGVIIPDGLKEIGNRAFYGCSGLTDELRLPDSIISIGDYAFYNCSRIRSVILPPAAESIGDYAFYNCTAMEGELIFYQGLKKLGNYAFSYCYNLSGTINIPGTVEVIGNYAFLSCYGIKGDIIIGEGVKEIGYSAFSLLNNVYGTISLPQSLKIIKNNAFSSCHNLTGSLVIPDNVTTIEGSAFSNCYSLTEVHLGSSIESIGDWAFHNCKASVLTLPQSIKQIGSYAFYDCRSLTGEITLSSDTYLGEMAFLGTNISIKYVESGEYTDDDGNIYTADKKTLRYYASKEPIFTVPEFVEEIGAYAFVNSYIEQIDLSNVKKIERNAFYNCINLKSVNFGQALETINPYAFWYCTNLERIELPDSVSFVGEKAFSDCYNASSIVLGEGLQRIDNNAFYYCRSAANELILPDSLTSIGESAFYYCKTLSGVRFGGNLLSIGSNAFKDCFELKGDLIIPDSVETIGNYAFSGCTGLSGALYAGNNVETIGNYAFSGCTGLSGALTLGNNIKRIGNYAFNNCSKLTGGINIADSVISIGERAFYSCESLNGQLVLGSGLKTIGTYAFYNCKKLTGGINIADSVTSLGAHAFRSCVALNGELTIGSGIKIIPAYAFYSCSKLTGELNLTNVISIENRAFYNCSLISGIAFGDSLNLIEEYAFYNCSKIPSLQLPDSLKQIGAFSFSYCTALGGKVVDIPAGTLVVSAAFSGTSISINYADEYATDEYGNRYNHDFTVLYEYKSSLNSFIVPDTVTEIAPYAFYGKSALTSLTLPENLREIGRNAFYNCNSLQRLAIPESVSVIGINVLQGCSKLNHLETPLMPVYSGDSPSYLGYFFGATTYSSETVPATLKTVIINRAQRIGDHAFYKCTNLTSITLPDECISIGRYSVAYSAALESFTANGLKTIGEYAFYQCKGFKDTLVVPLATEHIGRMAYAHCSNISEVILPQTLIEIGDHAFYYNQSLSGTLVIPDSVTTINYNAFFECNLDELYIGKGLTAIGYGAFDKNINLNTLNVSQDSSFLASVDNVIYSKDLTELVFCPTGFNGIFILPEGVETIGEYAFYNIKGLTGIDFSQNIVISNIAPYALYGCGLQEITLPNTITTIGEYAFAINEDLTTAHLPEGINAIAESIFENCSNLRSVNIPQSVQRIERYAFYNCDLESVIIPSAVTSIDEYAFSCENGGTGLLSITFEEDSRLAQIGEYAFFGAGLESIKLPESVTVLGYRALSKNRNLKSIDLPQGISVISPYLFAGDWSLESITLPENASRIEEYAFYNCPALKKVIMSQNLISIGYNAFGVSQENYESTLSQIIFPQDSKLLKIEAEAFKYCLQVKELVLPDGIEIIEPRAFMGWTNAQVIILPQKYAGHRPGFSGDATVIYAAD